MTARWPLRRAGIVALGAVPILMLASLAPQSQRQFDRFLTDVPDCPINVIAGAPTTSSVRLSVLSASSRQLVLTYGPRSGGSPPKKVVASFDAGIPKSVELRGLAEGTAYDYTLCENDKPDGSAVLAGVFRTARKPGNSFIFDVQADSHLDGNSDIETYQNTLRNIVADAPDFLIDLGDTFMVDRRQSFRDSLKQYEAQRYWLSVPGSRMSVFLCLGNHDGEVGWLQRDGLSTTDWSRAQRERFFPSLPTSDYYSGTPTKGLYYAWQWGDALFIVLDPFVATVHKPRSEEDGWNWTLGEDQYRWLRRSLAATRARFKFVFIHHLVGGDGKDARGGTEESRRFEWGDAGSFARMRAGWGEPIHDLFKTNKVSAVFHGHDHLYARQERDGIVYVEVPQPCRRAGGRATSAGESGYTSGTVLGGSGHVRVVVRPEEARVEYVRSMLGASNRSIVDSVSIRPPSGGLVRSTPYRH